MNSQTGVDERVERVLRAFGAAEADAGLEGRVLSRLAEVRVEQAGGGPMWWARGAVACACLGLCVAAVWVGRERGVRPAEAPRVISMVSKGEAGPGARGVSEPKPEIATDGTVGTQRGYVTRVVAHVPRSERAADRLAADDVAVSEMAAPTRVAPPEPLTEQERLLLRAARRDGASALVEEDADGALRVEQTKRQAETRTLFAEFEKGLFAGINAAADE